MRIWERNSPADTTRKGEDMVPEPKQIPCTIVKTRVRQLCPVWRCTVKQRSTCSSWRVTTGEGGCVLKEVLTSWTAYTGTGSWQELIGSPGWSRFAGRTWGPLGNPRWSSL